MRIPWFLRVLSLLVLGGTQIGCGITDPEFREFRVRVDNLSVPAVVSLQDSILVRMEGTIGPNTCHQFSHFEVNATESKVRITVIATEHLGMACGQAFVELDEVYVAHPPFLDPFTVAIRQPTGPDLEKTVRVE